ncbi:MAG TPA: methylenetetrahydrofolate reductase C-terminal domain-containing protein [Kineosporiaceae bacterium]|nr:methylenetetrahydrofolate reductase C-terminal domain-containing protein [Kineosporiaceae bacterium]
MTGPDATGPARPGGLQELLDTPGRFTVLAEAVPWRGTLEDAAGERVHRFAADLRDVPGVDVVSVTDGAGGRAVLSAETLAARLAADGQRMLVHVTCRDRNRNELAALGWRLASAGLTDVLALSGDYPHEGFLGVARPVFDLDSVSLLALYSALGGNGFSGSLLTRPPARATRSVPGELVASAASRGPKSASALYTGAAVNPFARQAREAVPQYLKLERKVAAGARFAITQSGFDARRWHELSRYAGDHALPVHLVAGVYVLNPGAAKAFHAGRVPGVRLSDGLLETAGHWAKGEDRGRSFFLELAAMQVAVARGLGLAGVCLSGLSSAEDVARVLELAAAFEGDRWRELLPFVNWSDPGEFWLYPPDPLTGLTADTPSPWPVTGRRSLHHDLSRLAHEAAFVPGSRRGELAGRVIRAGQRAGLAPLLHAAEQVLKRPLYGCRDCGDCSLPDIAFLCPESQCVKNQRNGPCGGSRDGECEIPGKDCIWARAYDRLSCVGAQETLLRHPVTVQDNALRHSSSWANAVTGVDLHARREGEPRPVASPPRGQAAGPQEQVPALPSTG